MIKWLQNYNGESGGNSINTELSELIELRREFNLYKTKVNKYMINIQVGKQK